MQMMRAKTLLMLVVLGGYVLTLLGLPGVSVLCYGASHVAIESLRKNCLPEDSSVSTLDESTVLAPATADDMAENCIDVVIQAESASQRHTLGNLDGYWLNQLLAIQPELHVVSPVMQFTSFPVLDSTFSFFSSSPQSVLRSVILLV